MIITEKDVITMKTKKWVHVVINGNSTNYIVSDDGDIINTQTGKIKKTYFVDGYVRVGLSLNKRCNSYSVAKLMLESFFGKTESDDTVLYFRDSDVTNLNLNNIDYISHKELLRIQTDKVFDMKEGYFCLKENNYKEDEKWKLIIHDSLETHIAVSNYGRFMNVITLNFLKPSVGRAGQYPFITVGFHKNKKRKVVKYAVHRLVAEYFVENKNPEINNVVHHKNDNKLDYSYKNLEWTTPQKNSLYAYESGANPSRGEQHPNSVISERQAHKICQMISDGYRISEITRSLGVSRSVVRHIKDRTSWTHISKNYSFDNSYKYFIDERIKKDILNMAANGISNKEISEKFHIGISTITNIKKQSKDINNFGDSKFTESAILRMTSMGFSIEELSEISGFTKKHIKNILKFYN